MDLALCVITIILVQCTARVSLTKHDYDDFDPKMDETNEPVWMFSRVPILRNGPDFYEINNMIKGNNRVDGLSDFYNPFEDKKTIQKLKSEISQPNLNILDMEEYKGVPEVLRANKKPKFNRPSDLSGTNQLSPDVYYYKEFDELKEENYEKLKNKLFNPSGFMKTRIWISRAFKILRAIMKVIAEIKAIMQS